MKATGIVRKIDELGRVVIPKEIRRTMRIRDGEPLEIFTDINGEIIFKKYSPISSISSTAGEVAASLQEVTGKAVMVADVDEIVASAGTEEDLSGRQPGGALKRCIEKGERMSSSSEQDPPILLGGGSPEFAHYLSLPVKKDGRVLGAVALTAPEPISSDDLIALRISTETLKQFVRI